MFPQVKVPKLTFRSRTPRPESTTVTPTRAMTASMYHSIIKILATFRASSLPVQQTHYTMDLFDPFDDLSPVDEKIYQKLVGMLIWTMKLRIETQLAVIMACFHNSNPTQGDQTKVIRLLAYFSGCQDLGPTWHTPSSLPPATLLSPCILPLEVANFPSPIALAPTTLPSMSFPRSRRPRSPSTRLTPSTMRSQ